MPADDPLSEFRATWRRARRKPQGDPTAFTLATADAEGRPSARMLLLKDLDDRGFVFFTNYVSRKARELAVNPRAALCFHWHWIDEQVRAQGEVERLEAEASDAYFASRARGSQLGAWASRQSEPLPSRFKLLRRYLEVQARFAGRAVPRPDFWGGYRLVPDAVEFWRSRGFRLHDRYLYVRDGDGRWERTMLYP